MDVKNSRREFLKTTTKASVAVAVGGLALAGCKDNKQVGVLKGKSTKEEVLYTGNTEYWKTYYSVAK
ncbi:hypothetical protein CQA57_07565 [Helicobacter anseris]|uniref:Tat pathway signal protein n=1 Tax=Helicobacter anseris TaxID=375926 RepID=A0A3D8J2I9_9HELI|nr:twin-arginine translocation signal domain-containing protein [Helicobacter anseris]RDU71613.1 hypothetical protein CQA57_07565 [Helicobacter anseris]